MKKSESKKLIALLTKQSIETLTLIESKELAKLLGQQKTATNTKVKDAKEKFAKASEKAEKQAKNIVRMAIVQALEIYADAGLEMDGKAFNVSYKAKASAKPSAKYIEIKTPIAIKKRAVIKNPKAVEQAKVKAEAKKILAPLFENK